MIKVLIVEDSPVIQTLLNHILSADPEIHVIGIAKDGWDAVETLRHKKPDVITMDVMMPKMHGFEATRNIMETNPVPIIIVSGIWNPKAVKTTFRAMEAGAVAVVEKPRGVGHSDFESTTQKLVETVKLMSEVKVVRRMARSSAPEVVPTPAPLGETVLSQGPIKLVAIGGSTGATPVLQAILSQLPKDFPVPVLIVQHIAPGFLHGLVKHLGVTSSLLIHTAGQGQCLLPGHVYLAPDDFHMGVTRDNRIILSKDQPEDNLRPSVSYLFRSVANVYGKTAVGILLTGMGRDGAAELKLIKEKGGITLAQDKESSVIFGMPKEAIKLDAVTHVLSPDGIAATLESLVNRTA